MCLAWLFAFACLRLFGFDCLTFCDVGLIVIVLLILLALRLFVYVWVLLVCVLVLFVVIYCLRFGCLVFSFADALLCLCIMLLVRFIWLVCGLLFWFWVCFLANFGF